MASVKVFGSPTSSEVARVLACLFEKEVDFQLIRLDNYKGVQRKPEYLKLQSREQYAATYQKNMRRKGTRTCLVRGTLERALIEQWLQTEAQSCAPPSSALVFHLAFAPMIGIETDEMVVEESKKKLAKVLDIYEQRLQETRFLAGDKFTLADLSHLPNAHRIVKSTECAKLFMSRKMVSRWWEEISGRLTWKKVVEMQKEAPPAS
ncbi:hypothetical protein J5N97_029166 [Dioscorea zingiberensis]|uniref:glutathione transferase n=1 Tax=Dioscorea zingiberensis TaxID=325984 RepID=A0A9D5C0V8_9LILI|nr:hypothetical protein J5N97_029166 [Dioscorea zingiberensis]